MSESTDTEIPDPIIGMVTPVEMENMRARRGWATGTVVKRTSDGTDATTITDAWIELFNGEGEALEFGGVRFMAVHDGEYTEGYAYATEQAAIRHTLAPYYYVAEYDDPGVDYGQPAP